MTPGSPHANMHAFAQCCAIPQVRRQQNHLGPLQFVDFGGVGVQHHGLYCSLTGVLFPVGFLGLPLSICENYHDARSFVISFVCDGAPRRRSTRAPSTTLKQIAKCLSKAGVFIAQNGACSSRGRTAVRSCVPPFARRAAPAYAILRSSLASQSRSHRLPRPAWAHTHRSHSGTALLSLNWTPCLRRASCSL